MSKTDASLTNLQLSLTDPGMDLLLRAGIGGLATTLLQWERQTKRDQNPKSSDGYFADGVPWEVTSKTITFHLPETGSLESFFKPIFEFAFSLQEDMIDLPATYHSPQNALLKSQLQRGLMLTFLQHGKSRQGGKKDESRNITIDGHQYSFSVRALTAYKHQNGFSELIDKRSKRLLQKSVELPGTLYPGAAVRHNAFAGKTKYEASVAQLLAAYFAPIGTPALPVNRGSAVLLVPEVNDLVKFAECRAEITPQSAQDSLIGGTGDAVLQLYARLRGEDVSFSLGVNAVTAYLFQPTAWATQQKSRVAAERIEPLDQRRYEIFQYARQYFAPRRASRVIKEKQGTGRTAKTIEHRESFWSRSLVRPLIAENLAHRQPWYKGFTQLFVARDPANNQPLHDRLFFERKQLNQMIQSDVWEEPGQKALVEAVHYALKGRYGQISRENQGNPVAMKNRFRGEYDRWRFAFTGSKTASQFRKALCDLFARVPANNHLQKHWADILPWLSEAKWEYARDLALLALASYQGTGEKQLAEAVEAKTASES